jgi:hypothetical protein
MLPIHQFGCLLRSEPLFDYIKSIFDLCAKRMFLGLAACASGFGFRLHFLIFWGGGCRLLLTEGLLGIEVVM